MVKQVVSVSTLNCVAMWCTVSLNKQFTHTLNLPCSHTTFHLDRTLQHRTVTAGGEVPLQLAEFLDEASQLAGLDRHSRVN